MAVIARMDGRRFPGVLALVLELALVSSAVLILSPSAEAAPREVRYKDTPLEVREGDRIVISGFRGTIRLTQPATGGRTPVLRSRKTLGERASSSQLSKFEALALSVRREGSVLVIETKGPAGKADIIDWLKPGSPEMTLEIDGLGVPVEVALHSGSVALQGWKAPATVSLVDGAVRASTTEGPLRVQLQKGEAKIDGHRGKLEFDGFGAKLVAQNIDGDLRVDNFGGESALNQIKGSVQLRTHNGGSSVTNSNGALDFDLGRGGLNIQGFEGQLRGQTEAGSVAAVLEGEADVNIESNQGPVAVRLPSGSGAFVRMVSDSGALTPPESVRPSQNGPSKTAVGRMPGSGPKGTVVVRSKTGSIRVR